MIKTILNLTWKEVLQLFRDRLLLVFLIVLPVSQLFLISEATGAGVRGTRLAVWDQERSDLSQQLITALDHTDQFDLYYRAQSYEELQSLVDNGDAAVGVIIPPDLSRNAFRQGSSGLVSVIVDGSNTIVAGNLLTTLDQVVADLVRQTAGPAAQTGSVGGIQVQVDTAFNPTMNLRVSTLPAQLAFVTYQLVLVVAAVGLVRERELGTMEQLVVTPISRLELVLGKAMMAMIIGLGDFYLLILLLTWGLGIPMRGDLALLFALGVLFIVCEIGWGTLVSIISTTQQQAILIVFLLAIVEVTFSGYLVPTANMPGFMRVIAQLSPLQHFMAIVRAVYLRGATLPMLIPNVAALVALAIVTTTTAWVLFVRTTDW